MKNSRIFRMLAAAAAASALALSLAGCSANADTNDEAAQNRQCLSALNSKVAELQVVMQDFETAASEWNIVAMQTQAGKADDVLDRIREQQATPALADIKDQYVQAIESLDQAMDAYMDLYSQVQAGDISSGEVQKDIEQIQASYDGGVEMLEKADDAVAKLAE